MTRQSLVVALCVILLSAVSWVLVGCSQTLKPVYVVTEGSYDTDSLEARMRELDPGDFAEVATADADEARSEALSLLRSEGEDAGRVADLLVSGFPKDAKAVPFRIEETQFEGSSAWVVFEVWGEEGGTLVHKRAWVFDRHTGDLLWSASMN